MPRPFAPRLVAQPGLGPRRGRRLAGSRRRLPGGRPDGAARAERTAEDPPRPHRRPRRHPRGRLGSQRPPRSRSAAAPHGPVAADHAGSQRRHRRGRGPAPHPHLADPGPRSAPRPPGRSAHRPQREAAQQPVDGGAAPGELPPGRPQPRRPHHLRLDLAGGLPRGDAIPSGPPDPGSGDPGHPVPRGGAAGALHLDPGPPSVHLDPTCGQRARLPGAQQRQRERGHPA